MVLNFSVRMRLRDPSDCELAIAVVRSGGGTPVSELHRGIDGSFLSILEMESRMKLDD